MKALGRIARAALVVQLSVTLAACTAKKISDIDSGDSTTVIDGISVPYGVSVTDRERHLADVRGLYPSNLPHDRACCWIAPEATIVADKVGPATTVSVTLFVPALEYFRRGAQSVTVRSGSSSKRLDDMVPGSYIVSLPLEERDRARDLPVTIEIRSDRTFVPARERFNSDTRSLAIILLGVTFQ